MGGFPGGFHQDVEGNPRFASVVPLSRGTRGLAYLNVPAKMTRREFANLLELLELWKEALVEPDPAGNEEVKPDGGWAINTWPPGPS
jgi:hypothetical protein